MPRCCPAAYGSLPLRKSLQDRPGRGPRPGARGGRESEERRARRRLFAATGNTWRRCVDDGSPAVVKRWLQFCYRDRPVERVAARPPVSRATRSAAWRRAHAGSDELRDGRDRLLLAPSSSSPGPEHERDLPFRRLSKASRRRSTPGRGRPPRTASSARGRPPARRSGWASASERRLAGRRRGDSNATAGQGQPRSSPHSAARAASPARKVAEKLVALRGEARSRRARSRPRMPPAARSPGTPASRAAAINRAPGSLMPGIPASVTSAMRAPATSLGSISALRAASLCSW